MFGYNLFADSLFASSKLRPVTLRAWNNICPQDSIWSDQGNQSTSWGNQTSQNSIWNDQPKDNLPSIECNRR